MTSHSPADAQCPCCGGPLPTADGDRPANPVPLLHAALLLAYKAALHDVAFHFTNAEFAGLHLFDLDAPAPDAPNGQRWARTWLADALAKTRPLPGEDA